jgi:tetratricopeptide (TPR) repeat protein
VTWLLVQIATQGFPFLEIANWVVRLVIALVVIGFAIALVIAWAFEATPEGIKRTETADAMPPMAGQKKHRWMILHPLPMLLSRRSTDSTGFDYSGAIAEYGRTLQLNPNDATARQWFANDTLANVGQTEREITEMKRAVELDPLSLVINSNLGVAYIHAGRLDEAIAQLRKTVELDGTFYYARYNLAPALELKGLIP